MLLFMAWPTLVFLIDPSGLSPIPAGPIVSRVVFFDWNLFSQRRMTSMLHQEQKAIMSKVPWLGSLNGQAMGDGN